MKGSIANALDNPKSTNVLGHTGSARLAPERIPQVFAAQRLEMRLAAQSTPLLALQVMFSGPRDSTELEQFIRETRQDERT